jgi:DNA-binding transcriptional MocR family regulator
MPAEGVRAAADAVLARDPAGALSYGPGSGYGPLRDWIADRHQVEPECVLVTNGSLQGGIMLFHHLLSPGDTALVEAPSYDRTLLALRDCGAELIPIPLEDDGLDVIGLESILEAGARPKLIHTITNFHNPAGCTLSLAKRERLLELAAQHKFVVFEDDPYREVRFEGDDLPTILSLDNEGRVVYASSFSKTIAPGVRVGYLIGRPDTIAAIQRDAVNTYISPNMLAEAIVAEFCMSGAIDESISTVRKALRERRDAVARALEQHVEEARFVLPQGGYFLWVDLPEEVDTALLLSAAEERGVTFVKGADFMLEGGHSSLRLAYSAVSPDEAAEGVERLAKALAGMRAAAGPARR